MRFQREAFCIRVKRRDFVAARFRAWRNYIHATFVLVAQYIDTVQYVDMFEMGFFPLTDLIFECDSKI